MTPMHHLSLRQIYFAPNNPIDTAHLISPYPRSKSLTPLLPTLTQTRPTAPRLKSAAIVQLQYRPSSIAIPAVHRRPVLASMIPGARLIIVFARVRAYSLAILFSCAQFILQGHLTCVLVTACGCYSKGQVCYDMLTVCFLIRGVSSPPAYTDCSHVEDVAFASEDEDRRATNLKLSDSYAIRMLPV
jgi:hypothetical protein